MSSSILSRRTAPAAVATLLSLGLLAGCGNDDTGATDPLADAPTSGATSAPTSSAAAPTSRPVGAADTAALVYFVTETSMGDRLAAERTDLSGTALAASLSAIQAGKPTDPDYRSVVPADSLRDPSLKPGKEITVSVAAPSYAKAMVGTSPADAKLAVQEVVYTLNAAAGTSKKPLPVHFVDASGKDSTYLGQPSLAKVAPQLRVLSLMNVYSPSEGDTVDRGVQHFDGVGSSFEATVAWQVEDSSGKVVLKGSTMSAGWQGHLYPWKAAVDLSKLSPGTYTFIASTDDPTGGEGPGAVTDSRSITVQ